MGRKKKSVKLTKKKLKKIARLDKKKRLKAWADTVRERDNNSCVVCGVHRGDLYINKKGKTLKQVIHAHHVFPKEITEFMYDVNNGISVCPKHHKYSTEISAHKNSLVFVLWLMKNRRKQYEYLKKRIVLN